MGVVIEIFKGPVSWWEPEGFTAKVELALLERHETGRSKESRSEVEQVVSKMG